MSPMPELIGRKLWHLTVMAIYGNKVYCRCECGKELRLYKQQLVTGRQKSCGCFRHSGIHGASASAHPRHPEYVIWSGIKQRCTDPNVAHFPRYGGRGIKICKEWADSFATFLAYVGPRPSPEHSIDRWPDKDGDYRPGNVRWATLLEQGSNKRNNRLIAFNGKRQHLEEWARQTGLSSDVLYQRLGRLNWSVEEALTTPVGPQGPKRRSV